MTRHEPDVSYDEQESEWIVRCSCGEFETQSRDWLALDRRWEHHFREDAA